MNPPAHTFWQSRYVAWDSSHPAEAVYLGTLPNIPGSGGPAPSVEICAPCNAIRWHTTTPQGPRAYIVSGAKDRAEIEAAYPLRITDGFPFSQQCSANSPYYADADRPGAPDEKTKKDFSEVTNFFKKPQRCTPFQPKDAP